MVRSLNFDSKGRGHYARPVHSEEEMAKADEWNGAALVTRSIPPLSGDSESPCSGDRFRAISFEGVKFKPRHVPCAPNLNGRFWPVARRMSVARAAAEAEVPLRVANFALRVLRSVGLNPGHYRMGPLARRIPACLRALKVATLDEAEALLRDRPECHRTALDSLLIGTTSYFRDEQVFDFLKRQVVPELLRKKRHPKVWSAACSEGAELYSAAILFAEHGPLEPGQFFGTDCRVTAIDAARRAHGSADFLARLAAAGLSVENLHPAVGWSVEDVLKTDRKEAFDMILCRNLAIYLESADVAALWARLAAALVPGGALVVGKAEKVAAPGLYRQASCVYRKISPPLS